jgi:hypothetical protein
MMALYYAKMLASQVELEGVMKGHMATATELRRATVEAERAGAAKAEFLAKMSHELRTPLNAVIGYSQMLLEDAEDEGDAESAADLDRIHRAGHHLLRLVNEVLDLSKIEAGKMDLNPETIEAATFMTNLVDGYRAAAEAAGNRLELESSRPAWAPSPATRRRPPRRSPRSSTTPSSSPRRAKSLCPPPAGARRTATRSWWSCATPASAWRPRPSRACSRSSPWRRTPARPNTAAPGLAWRSACACAG